ncbi:hypothetical protein DFH08DRAFT_724667 [Mycena albidolilacea]|uniref:Uncharacterized protein n=1 Tax=Mycena albidolilacea TaxID=1033008 RepID=A0AAD7E6T6_9AGAR|nr:hypothetical protein DFH08DRAFT_724667 [Mycena albidolilacea]
MGVQSDGEKDVDEQDSLPPHPGWFSRQEVTISDSAAAPAAAAATVSIYTTTNPVGGGIAALVPTAACSPEATIPSSASQVSVPAVPPSTGLAEVPCSEDTALLAHRDQQLRPGVPGTNTTAAGSSIICPSEALEWFSSAFSQMTATNLGPHFDALLVAWTRIETASKFENGPYSLSSKGRPAEVTRWIQGKHSRIPEVKSVTAYSGAWWRWWDSLQPEWRVRGSDGKWAIQESYGEWEDALLVWGNNGHLTLVASLYFWGLAALKSTTLPSSWEAAVIDVTWILKGIALDYENYVKKSGRR